MFTVVSKHLNLQSWEISSNMSLLRLTKRFEIMVGATLNKNLGSPIPKQSSDSYLQEIQE